jgi:hypothetical protein
MKKQVFKVRRKRARDKSWVYFDRESGAWVNADYATVYGHRFLADPVAILARQAYPQDVVEVFVTEIEIEVRPRVAVNA